MTTDRSNLLTQGIFGMRMCYSITGVGASPGLRSCTHNLPAVPGLRPSSSTRSSSPTGTLSSRVFRCSFPRVSRCSGRSGGRVAWAAKCHRRAPQCGRNATLGLHSSGTAARLSGGRARTGATENLGSRRRLGEEPRSQKVPTPSAPSKGFTHSAGTIRETVSEIIQCLLHQSGPSFPTPATLAASLDCLDRFRVDGSTFKVLCSESPIQSPGSEALFRVLCSWC